MSSPGNLTRKLVKGSVWLAALQLLSQTMIIVRLIILARLLMPVDFGIMGVGMMLIATLEAFSQTGITQALIQKKGTIKHYFNEAWTFLFLRGVCLFGIVFVATPFVSQFFLHNNDAVIALRCMGIHFLIQACSSIGLAEIQKEMEFHKHFYHQFSATAADFIVSVSIAIMFRNIWALVAGMLVGAFVGCAVSYMIHPFRPSFAVDFRKIRSLLSFGKWNTGSSICIFIGLNIDNIVIGRMLGPSVLGLYQLAFRVSNLPASEISNVLGKAAFPAYAKLQERRSDLKTAFVKVLKMIQFMTVPIGFMIIIMGHDFTRIFLGEKWLPMVPAMRLLAIGGIIKSIGSTGTYLFIGSGRPEKDFHMQLARAVVLSSIIYPLVRYYGITGAATGVIASLFVMSIVWYINISGMMSMRTREYLALLYPTVLGSLIMAVITGLLKKHIFLPGDAVIKSVISFAAIGLVGVMVYIGSLYIVWLILGNESSLEDLHMIGRIIKK